MSPSPVRLAVDASLGLSNNRNAQVSNRLINDELRDCFWRDGVIVLRRLVDEEWRQVIGQAIEADICSPGPYFHGYEPEDGRGRFHGNLRTWEQHEGFRRFCLESPLPEIAREILASKKVNLLYDQLFVKEPGTSNRTRWHNDQPYWPINGRQVLTFWVALDYTDLENGALEFIRASHNWNRFFQPEALGRTNATKYELNPDYEPMPDIEAARDTYEIVSFDLAPGDACVFHSMIVHGSPGNLSGRRRRGYAVRYTGDDVTYSCRQGTNEHLRNALLKDGDSLDSTQYPLVLGRG